MANKDKTLSDAEVRKLKAQREKDRAKREKKRSKDKARQERDAKRYEKAAEAARKKAASEREAAKKRENDPKYKKRMEKQAAALKAKGKKEMEKNRKHSAKKAKKASKKRAKAAKREEKQGFSTVDASGRRRSGAGASKKARKAAIYGKVNGKEQSGKKSSGRKDVAAGASKHRRNARISLVVILIIAIAAAFMLWPPQDKITMGLDIQGGLSVNLTAKTSDGGTPTSDQMDEARQVISSRVNASGASNATVQTQGSNAFLVQVPGEADSDSILSTLSSQGVLEFVRADKIESDTVTNALDQGIYGMNLKDQNATYESFMNGDHITNTTVDRPQGSADYAVNLQLDSEGTQAFADASRDLVSSNGKICIVLDGVVKSAPAVQAAITDGRVQITGSYTSDEANDLKAIIDSGSLPVSLTVESSSMVGPTLGNSALMVGVFAALIGLAVVIIWLLLFYKGLGLMAGVAICIMSVIYLGLLALLSSLQWFSLTLPGVAGIIVNIGMSADSSILIMECFHEQIRQGKSVKSASISGVHEGIFTSIDADLVTLVSALVLYFVAVGDVRGFGLTLALGILCDLLIMALFAGPVIRLLAPRLIARHPGFWGIMDDVNEGRYMNELIEGKKKENAEKGNLNNAKQGGARAPRGLSAKKEVN